NSLAPANSAPFTVIAGAATKLVFTTSPGTSLAGATFGAQPVVTVQDAYGNTASSSASITLSIKSGTPTSGGPGTLTCAALTKNATNGIDTFSSCSINIAGTAYQLHATASGLTAADSASFDVTNPLPTTTGISPAIQAIGDSTFPLTVNGTNFVSNSQVLFAG